MLILPVMAVRATRLLITATIHPRKTVLVLMRYVMQPKMAPMLYRKREALTKFNPTRRTHESH